MALADCAGFCDPPAEIPAGVVRIGGVRSGGVQGASADCTGSPLRAFEEPSTDPPLGHRLPSALLEEDVDEASTLLEEDVEEASALLEEDVEEAAASLEHDVETPLSGRSCSGAQGTKDSPRSIAQSHCLIDCSMASTSDLSEADPAAFPSGERACRPAWFPGLEFLRSFGGLSLDLNQTH